MTHDVNRTKSVCFYFFTVTALTIAGPPGPPGPPGPASNAASVSETLFTPQQDATKKRTITQQSHRFFPPFVRQLKTFATRDSMMQHTSRDAEGTLSYVTGTGSLYLKVAQGWKEIQVLSLFPGVNNKHQQQHQSNVRSFLFIIWNFSYLFKRCPAARQPDLPLQ